MAVRVLVADGSTRIRDAIRQRLECIGCEIIAEAETAAQALPLFRTVRPEIVAIGAKVSLGGDTTTSDVVRLIRTEMPSTEVVIVGGAAGDSIALSCSDAGALDWMCEPFDANGFRTLWRKLAAVYPELKMRGFGPMLSARPTFESTFAQEARR
jgi:DNA-binding NarL/FixJ family response regulator